MNTQTNSIRPVCQNIEDFIAIAKNIKWHDTDVYTPIAGRFVRDLDTLTSSKIWRDRVAADESIKKLKEFYIVDANATIDDLENEIVARFNNYKIENPIYYRDYKEMKFYKAMKKLFDNI